jgi:hypothetical protein
MNRPQLPKTCAESSPNPERDDLARSRLRHILPSDKPHLPRTRDVLDAFEFDEEDAFPGELVDWDLDDPCRDDR